MLVRVAKVRAAWLLANIDDYFFDDFQQQQGNP